MIHIGLFEGLGGFSLAARWAGFRNLATCEIADFPRTVLEYHFPEAYHHHDIHDLTYETINTELSRRFGSDWRNDDIILTGGFPCQPYSNAGKRLGKEDPRHLWPEMLRCIREIAPTWIVGENVRGIVSWNEGMVFEEVCADLEAQGYQVWPVILPAAGIGAPHRRDRVWFIAYSASGSNGSSRQSGETKSNWGENNDKQSSRRTSAKFYYGCRKLLWPFKDSNSHGLRSGFRKKAPDLRQLRYTGSEWDAANTCNTGLQRSEKFRGVGAIRTERNEQLIGCIPPTWQNFPTQPPVRGGDDGIPQKLDAITVSKWCKESIKGYGNAVVPQIPYIIYQTILAWQKTQRSTGPTTPSTHG